MQKRSIGPVRALYPVPTVVIGVGYEGGKINWTNITHTGIIGEKSMMISVKKIRQSALMLKIGDFLSLNIIDKALLVKADYAGSVSGKNTDKSDLFAHSFHEATKVPYIDDAGVVMICKIEDDLQTKIHHQFILDPIDTIVFEQYLDQKDHVDYTKFKPILFDYDGWNYLETGELLGKCSTFFKQYLKKD